MEPCSGSRPRRVRRIKEYEIDGEIVLYDPQRNRTHVLNATSAVVWRLCDGTRDFEQLVSDMSILFYVAPAVIARDLSQVLKDFGRSHLMRHVVQRGA